VVSGRTHVEVLPRPIDLFPELALSKPRHLPRQPARLFVLTLPQPVEGWGVTRETAMLVLASTPAGTGNVSSDLRACMETHNVATLTRLALERQVALRLPPGNNRRILGGFSSRAWKLSGAPLLSSSGHRPRAQRGWPDGSLEASTFPLPNRFEGASRTKWPTCRFRCSVIQTRCNAIQTLVQLNFNNYIHKSRSRLLSPFRIGCHSRPKEFFATVRSTGLQCTWRPPV